MDIRKTLPIHAPGSDDLRAAGEDGVIRIEGLVAQPQLLSSATLEALPRARLTERFSCEEGWSVDGLTWEGISLSEMLALCQLLPEARYVRVCAGPYWIALPLADCESALLCDRLNGAPLAREHGAPWRLVVPGAACFTSVKWVRALELAAEAGDETAERIARTRLAGAHAD
ncbi:MAG TPA: molybdopterin-dependent oxidoreductase [Ktedonobacterales bacterium]